jgi:hypothetical protein
MSDPQDHRSLPRLMLACFVAQGAWWLVMGIVVAGSLVLIVGDAAEQSRGIVDVLLDGSLEFAGVPGSLVQYVLVVALVGGLLLMAGTFVVPILLRVFVRIVCGARVSYGWALVANFASWILLVALTLLLWVLPGAQPFAIFITWIGSSVVSALLLRPHLRTVHIDSSSTSELTERKAS